MYNACAPVEARCSTKETIVSNTPITLGGLYLLPGCTLAAMQFWPSRAMALTPA